MFGLTEKKVLSLIDLSDNNKKKLGNGMVSYGMKVVNTI